MAKRQVFFSFRYLCDAWRAGQIRNMRKLSDDSTFSDNDWETVRSDSPDVIKRWIDNQMKMRSCVIVLIGEYTQGRKWINYEIEQAWKAGKGIVGIYIHGLKDEDGNQAQKGKNPFEDFCIDTTFNYIVHHHNPADDNEKNLSEVVKSYDTPYLTSTNVYNYIRDNIALWIEEALEIRSNYPN